MPVIDVILLQLTAYSAINWLLFAAIAFTATWIGRWPVLVIGQIVVAIMILVLDVQWIRLQIHRPGWNGQPDQDIVFMLGVVLRILLINTALLPLNWIALRCRGSLRIQ